MTGDGLPDQVRITNGRVEYFPNMGNGRFGEVVVMENSPVIDFNCEFDASRIRLFDLDGSGTSDILYIGNGEIKYWYNASGNKFIEGRTITNLPYIDNITSAIIVDFLCNGTACLVWSNALNHLQYTTIQYLDLTSGIQPRLLSSLENSMGTEILIEYGYSATHFLNAKKEGQAWISKIPSHFTVVDNLIVQDHITKSKLSKVHRYKDGHYNGAERTFVGFGLIEEYDTQLFTNTESASDLPLAEPSCTRTWIHNGMFGSELNRMKQYYDKDPNEQLLSPQIFENTDALVSGDFERGFKSLTGFVIRQEIFAVGPDGNVKEHPFQIFQNSYCMRMVQKTISDFDSCFFAYQTESLKSHYEQIPNDPKLTHSITLKLNEYGDAEQMLSIAYARRSDANEIHPAQAKDYIVCNQIEYLNVNTPQKYHTGIVYENKSYEINFLKRNKHELVKYAEIKSNIDHALTNAISFDKPFQENDNIQARVIAINKSYFWNDAFNAILPHGQTGKEPFAHHHETASFNDALITKTFSNKINHQILSDPEEGNYIQKDGYWWAQSDVNHFKGADQFYCIDFIEDHLGNKTQLKYDPYFLIIVETTDCLDNTSKGEIDYNVMDLFRMIDQNDNVSEVLYDPLGIAIATFHLGSVFDDNNILQKYGNGRLEDYQRRTDENFEKILLQTENYLQHADSFLFYELTYSKKEKTNH